MEHRDTGHIYNSQPLFHEGPCRFRASHPASAVEKRRHRGDSLPEPTIARNDSRRSFARLCPSAKEIKAFV